MKFTVTIYALIDESLETHEKVVLGLEKHFGFSRYLAQIALDELPYVMKAGLQKEKAEKIVKALELMGAIASVDEEQTSTIPPATPTKSQTGALPDVAELDLTSPTERNPVQSENAEKVISQDSEPEIEFTPQTEEVSIAPSIPRIETIESADESPVESVEEQGSELAFSLETQESILSDSGLSESGISEPITEELNSNASPAAAEEEQNDSNATAVAELAFELYEEERELPPEPLVTTELLTQVSKNSPLSASASSAAELPPPEADKQTSAPEATAPAPTAPAAPTAEQHVTHPAIPLATPTATTQRPAFRAVPDPVAEIESEVHHPEDNTEELDAETSTSNTNDEIHNHQPTPIKVWQFRGNTFPIPPIVQNKHARIGFVVLSFLILGFINPFGLLGSGHNPNNFLDLDSLLKLQSSILQDPSVAKRNALAAKGEYAQYRGTGTANGLSYSIAIDAEGNLIRKCSLEFTGPEPKPLTKEELTQGVPFPFWLRQLLSDINTWKPVPDQTQPDQMPKDASTTNPTNIATQKYRGTADARIYLEQQGKANRMLAPMSVTLEFAPDRSDVRLQISIGEILESQPHQDLQVEKTENGLTVRYKAELSLLKQPKA